MSTFYRQMIEQEFKDFQPVLGYSGGCRKSLIVKGMCAHFNADGKIMKIEEGCDKQDRCGGFHNYYK